MTRRLIETNKTALKLSHSKRRKENVITALTVREIQPKKNGWVKRMKDDLIMAKREVKEPGTDNGQYLYGSI